MLKKIMNFAKITIAPAALVAFVGLALAADAPKDNKGFATSKTTTISLGPEFPGAAGLQLRLRMLTIEPGGHIGLHDHKERPTVAYFVQGTDTVIREDGSSKIFHAGDTTSEPGTTVHWHRNDGNDTVILIAVDVLKTGD
jgi:quercetin dioxygenase-like cupin family protein